MSRTIKILVYAVLVAAAGVLGWNFHRCYVAVMHKPETSAEDRLALAEPVAPRVSTNAPATNAAVAPTNAVAPVVAAPGDTNAPLGTNAVRVTPPKPRKPLLPRAVKPAEPVSASSLMSYGVGLFFVAITLALLAAHDLSHFVADRFHDFILSDDGQAMKDPAYERAEQVWADGQFLDAIRLMRDHLKNNPREQYVALRIAEIYEKDLGNPLAAALEYEEVLKHRFEAEQWGWAAIHLANLYSGRLNQSEKAVALLRRIDSEYGETAAAGKARARLAQLEGGSETAAAPEAAEPEPPPPPPPASNLPKGFRPRK